MSALPFTHFIFQPIKKNTHHDQHLAKNLRVQQLLQPLDPLADPVAAGTHLDSEGEKDGQVALASQISHPSELTLPSSTGNPPGRGECLGRVEGVHGSGCLYHFSIETGCCSVLCLWWEEPPPPINPPVFCFRLFVALHLPFGMSDFVFDHFNLSFRVAAEVLHHITPSLLLFEFVQLLSPFFVPSHVSHLICCCFPLPSTPRSASCGLNIAPTHTSIRHEAVRVWLESVSGGSADLKGDQCIPS